MTEEQAFNRIKWRIENGWGKPQDIKAFNTLVEAYEARNQEISDSSTLFAKMLITYIRQHAQGKPRPVAVLLREVEEIMQKPMEQILAEFQEEVPMYKFELILHQGTEDLDPFKDYGKIKRIREQNMRANQRALTDALKNTWEIDDAIQFIQAQVAKFTTTYASAP